ncbi:MAG: major facilitator superfamily transporter [Acidobacteriaceae bacterium]|nr:major facilitator superfamily transporter [Acidobacteriaceae bacterium]
MLERLSEERPTPHSPVTGPDSATSKWQYAVASGILGWILDAFDFFVVIFLVDNLAANFHVQKKAIVWTITAALAMRPVGALIFGSLADRFGRRKPLMLVVIYFSTITALSGVAPNYTVFLILRALYGIGMGGYWGIGASLAMESAPVQKRGILSGLMQAGYPLGYLLAALAVLIVIPTLGWRAMFFVGTIPALVTVYLTAKSPESEAWKQHHLPTIWSLFGVLFKHGKIFIYLVLLMSMMSCLSHGTQDLYPDFLRTEHNFSRQIVSYLAMFYNVGAILGALFFGNISERLGRRRSVIVALSLSFLSIPLWAFGASLVPLVCGSFIMQAGVQGAFGVVPAHLNELSPDAVRGLFPGLVYQLGVLIGSPAVAIEYALRDRFGYQWALTTFEAVVILSLVLIFALGPEKHGKEFVRET